MGLPYLGARYPWKPLSHSPPQLERERKYFKNIFKLMHWVNERKKSHSLMSWTKYSTWGKISLVFQIIIGQWNIKPNLKKHLPLALPFFLGQGVDVACLCCFQLYGYCYQDSNDIPDTLTTITELGSPLEMIQLLQTSWEDRFRVSNCCFIRTFRRVGNK